MNGTVQLVGGKVVFTPAPGFFGMAGFSYTLLAADGESDTGFVIV